MRLALRFIPLALIALAATAIALTWGLSVRGAVAGKGNREESRGHHGHGYWHPKRTTAPWQWQLQGAIDTSIGADVYDVDGFETPKSTVRRLHGLHRKVICYLDVGSWESYRPDAKSFPRSVIGRRYQGFPDERWLDVSRFRLFERPLKHRFTMCARKGFDAVEPDNLAGWEPENKTGFRITRVDRRAVLPGPRMRPLPAFCPQPEGGLRG